MSLSEVPSRARRRPTATTDSPPRHTHLNSRGCQARRRARLRDGQDAGGDLEIEAEENEPLATDWSLWRAFSRSKLSCSLVPKSAALLTCCIRSSLLGPGRNDAACYSIDLNGNRGSNWIDRGLSHIGRLRVGPISIARGHKASSLHELGGRFCAVRASVDPRAVPAATDDGHAAHQARTAGVRAWRTGGKPNQARRRAEPLSIV